MKGKGISPVEVDMFERVENSVILVCQRAQKEQTDALYVCDRQV